MLRKIATDPWLHIAALLWFITAWYSGLSNDLTVRDDRMVRQVMLATLVMCDALPSTITIYKVLQPGMHTVSEIASAVCARLEPK